MKIIDAPNAPKAIGPYSQAIEANGFLFLSGQIPLDPTTMEVVEGGITEQAKQVLANIQAVVEAAGTDKNSVIKATMFLSDMNNFAAANEVYADFFGDHKPARSTIEVARLPKDVLIEIEVIVKVA